MNILILGSGGREHALAWAFLQNPKCDKLIVAPGNAGIAKIADTSDLDIVDPDKVVLFCAEHMIEFVVIGPEAPLEAGVADALRAASIPVFGPNKAAAMLETSKSFTKSICDAANAPTASYAHFTNLAPALDYVATQKMPIVIKADGLAAGKGVVIAETQNDAEIALKDMFSGAFGDAGSEVVIEAFLEGEEASFFVLVDGETIVPFGTAQDHKRIGEGDTGANTGGMGAYSPAPVMTDDVVEKAMNTIIRPTMAEMAKRGTPYHGVLFAGFMIKDGTPSLVEYNVRFGDPECQVLMMRLGAQALDLIHAAATGNLEGRSPQWANDHAMTVVMAAGGYPGPYTGGDIIHGLDKLEQNAHETVFHAGTTQQNGQFVTSGGRVLSVSARADMLSDARERCYTACSKIEWDGAYYRKDIGWRAL